MFEGAGCSHVDCDFPCEGVPHGCDVQVTLGVASAHLLESVDKGGNFVFCPYSWMRTQAQLTARRASSIIMGVCASQSFSSCGTNALLDVSMVSVLSSLSLLTVELTVPSAVNVRLVMISLSVTAV